jgi:predicted nucleic acid-binding protein
VIFLDTGFLFALVSAKDEDHEPVNEVFAGFRGADLEDVLLTTNHVIAETVTLTRKLGHAPATRLGERLYGQAPARVHWTTPDEELEASNTSSGTATRSTASPTA